MGWSQTAPTIMDQSLGTLLRFCDVFQVIQVQTLPSPHKQCWTRVSRICSEFQLCIGWGGGGGGRTARKFWRWCTVLRGNREMTEKYEYCSTVPRTFVQDCRSKGNQIPGQKYRNHWRLKERKGQPSNIPKSRSRPGTNEWIKNKMITRPITTELFINSTLSRMTYWKTKRESWWRISLCKCILATCINLGHLAVNQPDELEEKKSSFM